MFVTNGTLLNDVSSLTCRNMPLSLDDDLPAVVLRFGTSSDNEVPFACHLDTCAAMNTGSLHLHQWIITNNMHIVDSYEQYDNDNPFNPITLDYAVPSSDSDKVANKLTAVVT